MRSHLFTQSGRISGEYRCARIVFLASARALGIAAATAQRNLDRMLRSILGKADRLIEQIEFENAQVSSQSARGDNENMLKAALAAEIRLLNTVRHIVLKDMVKQLS